MYSIWHQMLKIASGAYDAPPYPLVVRGFLPSAIAASRLRRSQFPHSDILVGPPTSGPWLRPCLRMFFSRFPLIIKTQSIAEQQIAI